MEEFLKLNQKERIELLQEAGARINIPLPIIMEKDFWVCWALDRIYSIPELSQNITFKGGTSLSKCYGIIKRFSEDCDLTVNRDYLGITSDLDPLTAPSTKQREKRLKALQSNIDVSIKEKIKPLLKNDFSKILSNYFSSDEWKLSVNEDDTQTLNFYYPKTTTHFSIDYIEPVVKLEFGARGDTNPYEEITINSYVQEALPEFFKTNQKVIVKTLTKVRTFWEKATLLHAEHHRDSAKTIKKRLFRHYYDIVMLDKHQVTSQALQKLDLLETVVKNKKTYFHSSWANYNSAKIGSLKLKPKEAFLSQLENDFRDMSEMFFEEPPSFKIVMDEIQRIENFINQS